MLLGREWELSYRRAKSRVNIRNRLEQTLFLANSSQYKVALHNLEEVGQVLMDVLGLSFHLSPKLY